MATYDELMQASNNAALNQKIRVACFVAAEIVRTEDPGTANHANRLTWARNVFAAPEQEAKRMLWAVLAQNRAFTLAQITGATDATVQNAVNGAIDVFAV